MADTGSTPDIYSDNFVIQSNPYGMAITFQLTPATQIIENVVMQPKRQAVIRMSLEMMKMLTFLLDRQVHGAERELGYVVPVSNAALNISAIGMEDWDAFWNRRGVGGENGREGS